VLISSSDGGKTWEQLWWYTHWLPGLIREDFGVSFVASRPRERVIMVESDDGASATVFYTQDGTDWRIVKLPETGRSRRIMDQNGQCAVIWQSGALFTIESSAPHRLCVLHFVVTDVEEPVEAKTERQIVIYPVPAREEMVLRYHRSIAARVEKVEVYTVDGKRIGEYRGRVERLSVETLPAGSYYLLVHLNGGVRYLIVFQVVH